MMITTAPGSPPELSSSRSSKSSSFHSSSQIEAEENFADISNFEDINLDDERQLSQPYPRFEPYSPSYLPSIDHRHSLPKRPGPMLPMQGSRNSTPTTGSMRNLTVQKRPRFPSLNSQVDGAIRDVRPLGLTVGGRRGLTSPSAPSLAMTLAKKQRSRSPSPTQPGSCPLSPMSMPSSTPRVRSGPSPVLKPRRSSWQPNRKSTAELEDECHDSDEEVPDDAVIWNVPMSPRPPQERSASAAASPSILPSPSSLRALSPLSSSSFSLSSSVPTDDRANPLRSPSFSKPTFSRGASTGSFPLSHERQFYSKTRAKSWTAALSELSEEAQTLTTALEAYAANNEREREAAIQSGKAAPRSGSPDKSPVRTSILELPPIRKSEIMIDPLPISKEKAAVLTRTRPSWLPPKSQKEERKHLKEYQKMMAQAQEVERQREERAKSELSAAESAKTTMIDLWTKYILPSFDTAACEPRTRELWWRGVPSACRGAVWEKAIGNDLALTGRSYDAALARARIVEEELNIARGMGRRDERESAWGEWFHAVDRDVGRVWPELGLFGDGGPLREQLRDVLKAYVAYRSDVGYCYGTQMIASLLLLTLPTPSQTFIALANILNRPLPLSFLTHDPSGVARTYSLILSTLSYKYPLLHARLFTQLQLEPDQVFGPMLRCLFTNRLDMEECVRCWDVMVFEGDKMIIRTAVGVLASLESKLLGADVETVLNLLGWDGHSWDVGGVEKFVGI
ncbi:MAG: hypothetical protein M1824_001500, partial [Vezdaea acicularis]